MMNDENNLESILQNLNNPEMSDTIKNLLDSFSSGEHSDSSNDVFSNLFSSIGNSNLDLLIALKPYLNKKRQKKLDQCENFISIIKTFEILNAFNQKE
jgi:transcription termination factor NusB